MAVSVAPAVLEQIAKAEAERKQNGTKTTEPKEMSEEEMEVAEARINEVMVRTLGPSACTGCEFSILSSGEGLS